MSCSNFFLYLNGAGVHLTTKLSKSALQISVWHSYPTSRSCVQTTTTAYSLWNSRWDRERTSSSHSIVSRRCCAGNWQNKNGKKSLGVSVRLRTTMCKGIHRQKQMWFWQTCRLLLCVRLELHGALLQVHSIKSEQSSCTSCLCCVSVSWPKFPEVCFQLT